MFAANHGRTITIASDSISLHNTVQRVNHNTKVVPGLLHANVEARSIAQRHYQKHLSPQFKGKAIYLNYDADTIYFPTFFDFNSFFRI
jgi:hypothetical protein